jgi:hypothetical protein
MSSRSAIRRAVTVLLLGLAEGVHPCAAEEGPAGFNCVRDRSPLAVTVCSDRTAAAAERRTTVSYLAVYFGLSDRSQAGFHNDHTQWLKSATTRCRPSPNLRQAGGDQPALSVECVRRLYTQRGDLYRKKLSGMALEESDLSPALLKKNSKAACRVEISFRNRRRDIRCRYTCLNKELPGIDWSRAKQFSECRRAQYAARAKRSTRTKCFVCTNAHQHPRTFARNCIYAASNRSNSSKHG